jgi:cytochrome P450
MRVTVSATETIPSDATRASFKKPPGPAGLLSYPKRFIDYCRNPLEYLTQIARQYGDVVLLQSFGMPFYMFNNPDHIEEILRRQHRSFKKDYYIVALRPLLGNGLLTSDGEEWRRQRAMAQPAFQAKQIQQYAATMVDFTQRMLSGWKPDQTVDIHHEMMRLTAQVVTKTLFDAAVDDEGDIAKDLEVAMTFYANPLAMWPAWRYIPTPTNLRFTKTLNRLNALIFGLISERRTKGTAGRTDLLSRLLEAEDEEGQKMSDTELRDQLMTLFLAGHETTALTLSFTFYLLAQYSDAEGKLHAELDRVLGSRLPTTEDVPSLLYAECVIKESMRLYPPAWTIGREALEDCEIGGYQIRKGTQALMSQWVVHRDPRLWAEPEQFKPDRWNEEATKNLPRCAYFPFGDGPRICIGNSFAMMEAVLLLATICQQFRLELVPDQKLRLVPSVTMRPRDGIKMIPRKRMNSPNSTRVDAASAAIEYAPT